MRWLVQFVGGGCVCIDPPAFTPLHPRVIYTYTTTHPTHICICTYTGPHPPGPHRADAPRGGGD
jgi:hypothetical protein